MRRFRKIFSCALVVISFILLFTSWTILTPKAQSVTVDYYNTTFKPEKELKSFPAVMSELQKLKLDEMLGVSSIFGENIKVVDSVYDESGLRSLIGALSDGGMDVTQTALAARTIKTIVGYVRSVSSMFSSADTLTATINVGLLTAYNAVVIILFILAILLAIATFLVRLLDRFTVYRKYDLAFFIVQLLLFILTVVFVGAINAAAGAGYPVLGITLWGILAVIFACPSIWLDRVPLERLAAITGRSTAVNETAYAFSGTVSKTIDKISNKMDETAQGVRLARELKTKEEQMKDYYAVLGQHYYTEHVVDPPESLRDTFQEIADQKKQIEQLRKDIDIVNNVVACPNCQTRWPSGTKFCAECGTKLPSITQDREEFDYEMKQKKEKRAGKSFCKYCGAKVEDDDEFCPGCGERI